MFEIFEKRWDCICVPNEDIGNEEEHLFPLVALVPNVLVGNEETKHLFYVVVPVLFLYLLVFLILLVG
jgi:hypothetical protein